MLHGVVLAVGGDEDAVVDVVADVGGVVRRGRHCAGVTGLWEVTDRDKALSQPPTTPERSHINIPTHGPLP